MYICSIIYIALINPFLTDNFLGQYIPGGGRNSTLPPMLNPLKIDCKFDFYFWKCKNIFCGNELPSPIFPLFDITTHKKERKKHLYDFKGEFSEGRGRGMEQNFRRVKSEDFWV